MLSAAVLVEARYRAHRQPAGLIAALEARGHEVRIVDPRERIGDSRWFHGAGIVIARGRSWDLLASLTAAETAGVPTVNRRAAIAAVHNKAEMAVRLAASGISMPRTYIGTTDRLAATIEPRDYPVIVKPIFGDNCRGLRVFCSAGDLQAVEHPEVMVVQQFVPNDGFDVKLYGIGSDVWVIRKPSPLSRIEAEPELLPVTREARDLARRCSRLFGLDLYGVDCVMTAHGLNVIEVNDYPNYTGITDADDRLARRIEHTAS